MKMVLFDTLDGPLYVNPLQVVEFSTSKADSQHTYMQLISHGVCIKAPLHTVASMIHDALFTPTLTEMDNFQFSQLLTYLSDMKGPR